MSTIAFWIDPGKVVFNHAQASFESRLCQDKFNSLDSFEVEDFDAAGIVGSMEVEERTMVILWLP